jgi:hypothetical protein
LQAGPPPGPGVRHLQQSAPQAAPGLRSFVHAAYSGC